jgi:hypothetical protein
MPPVAIATIILLPLLVFGAGSIWMRHSPFYHPKLAEIINSRLGANVFESFLVRLRPLLLFAVAAILQSLVGLWHSYRTGSPSGTLVFHAFFLSGGLAFALAHTVLYFRRAVGVYPTWTLGQPEPAAPERKTLSEALRAYWWTLVGLALFPPVVFVGGEFFQIPFEYFMLPFFAVGFLAGWPWFSGRAPYSFVLVAGGVWLFGGIVAAILSGLIHSISA